MRILAVDFGERRIGVAISDPMGLIAQPWGILKRASNRQAAGELAALARELGAEEIVLGLPLDADGSEGYQARRVRRFATLLRESADIPVVLWDESLTTVDAESLLSRQKGRRGKRARAIDDVAAAVLLQSYLDRQSAERAAERNTDFQPPAEG